MTPPARQAMVWTPIIAFALGASAAPHSGVEPTVGTILTRDFKFSASDLSDLQRGLTVRKSLAVTTPGEVAVVGAIRVRARKETLVERYRDIAEFKRHPDVLQVGRFSATPSIDDLAALTITRDDIDLRDCRPRDCDVRLPEEAITRVHREIDWKAPDADARAAALFKLLLVENAAAYRSGGPGRITQYDDGSRPIRPTDDLAGLVAHSEYLDTLLPGLRDRLSSPSRPVDPATAGDDDFLYWSKERFGMAPFISVTHVLIAPAGAGRLVIASKDVYSSRYLDASLSIAIASDAVDDPTAFHLIYVNRSRANALKGVFSSLRRSIVERRARNALDEQLRELKRTLER